MKFAEIIVSWLSKPNSVLFVFAIYIILRALSLIMPLNPQSDADWYFGMAIALAEGNGYSENGIPTAYWPPGWPMALSSVFRVFGTSLAVAKMFNLVCSLITAWLTLDLGRRLFHSAEAGILGLFLLAIYPNNIAYTPSMLTEVFYTMLLLFGCWLFVVKRETRYLLLAGLVFGFATLVKAQTLFVVPLLFLVAILRERIDLTSLARASAKFALIVVVALVTVFPWAYRNYQLFGEWVAVSTNGGINLYIGNNPRALGYYGGNDKTNEEIGFSVKTQVAADREARERAVDWIRSNPVDFIVLLPRKFFHLWVPDGESEWQFQSGSRFYDENIILFRTVRYINQAYYFALIFGFLLAGYLLFYKRRPPPGARLDWWLLPYIIVGYITIVSLLIFGGPRFHFPAMPFVAMCCGWVVVSLGSSSVASNPALKAHGSC